MNLTLFSVLLLSLIGSCLALGLLWCLAVKLDFFSLIDVAWAYGITLLALTACVVGPGHLQRRILTATLALLWGERLGTHLLQRLRAQYPKEDTRYDELKTTWGTRKKSISFLFFQFQAITLPLFALPFITASFDRSPNFHWNEFAALTLVLIGITGEALADFQLKAFKANPFNRPRVCDIGLWRYSRHPNYFFEWTLWCGFALWAASSPHGLFALLCPVAMLLLLLFVTGIPPSEAQALKSRGDTYRQYQATTSRFIPLPRKR
jgi:steroid 5-alpha reductase family enzyme